MRTFYYREYLPGGEYYSQLPADWEKKATFADGHRLNQPEPDNLIWSPDEPYYPYKAINPTFKDAGLSVKYYLPRNESNPYDTNMTIEKIMETTTNYGFFHFMPHGGITNLRIEVGNDNITGRQNVFLEAATINELNYKAPTMIYTTCCKGGVWMLDTGYESEDFITSSFIHAGAVAYIATPEIQSTCFWDEAPYGTATEQASNFWKNVFSGNVPIGDAFRAAKGSAFSTWNQKTPKPTSSKTHHVDSISYTLFGDPALELFKPNKEFKDQSLFDIIVKVDPVSELTTTKDFTITVNVFDKVTSSPVTDAEIKVTFNGLDQTGTTSTFTAPKDPGEQEVMITVSKTDYTTASLSAWIQIQQAESDDDSDGEGFIPGFENFLLATAFAIVLALLTIINIRKK
jgi:hypothetical protein